MTRRLRRSRTAIVNLPIAWSPITLSAAGLFAASLFAAGLFVAEVAEAQPPKLHQVADHWTAWDPPETIPEGSAVHIIEPGDTLWALAGRFLGDPYRWPELWESNKYILDAEWIYPGDPLVVPATQVGQAEGIAGPSINELAEVGVPSEEDPFQIETETVEDSSRFSVSPQPSVEKPIPLGFESDIYCTGYISDKEEEFPYRISGSEYESIQPNLKMSGNNVVESVFGGDSESVKLLLGVGDLVYIQGGRADGLSAGTVLVAIRPEYKVNHPRTRKSFGRYYHYTARIRVLTAQEEMSIGEIIASCDPVSIGATLREFEPEPVPLRRMTPLRPVNYPSTIEEIDDGPTILVARDRVISMGAGNLVWIDRGADDDVAPGDIFTIYRRGRRGFPPIVLGEAAVLSVSDRAALTRILRSRYSIYLGDSMVLK